MNRELLFDLLQIPSPSGHEERMKAFLVKYLDVHGIKAQDLGPAGLSWGLGEGDKLAFFSVHIDQVAFVADRIDDEGYIYLKMPGIDPRIAPSQELTVRGKRELVGVVGMRPPHFLSEEEQKAPIPSEKLYVDVGLPGEEVKRLVPVGTVCTWRLEPLALLGSRVTGVGLDNKAGVFLALLVTEALGSKKLPGRIRFFASTQEEGVMFGAGFAGRSAYKSGESVLFAVVVDTTFGTDHEVKDSAFPLGKGSTLGVGPILSKSHLAIMRSIASELSIPYSLEPLTSFTGTEADVLSISGKGIPTILLSIPLRNMHSPVEIVDLDDVESSLKLLSAALQREDLWSS
ncbi:MAG: M20/M25/M40 family metallo-hydrolase [Candidatus Stahlbacteria bacterium]|nr:MAG: M20/M25/M40 family metallo-hydrolase [Candidatus Stahlbacteria bacterium]